MILNNYHTHTYRCGHASGSDEEYVLEAIKNGLNVLGFSDHIPFNGFEQKGIRMNFDMIDDYVSSLKQLKEKYKDKIDIHIGLEAEYVPERMDYYKNLMENKGIEYFIIGQHMMFNNDGFIWSTGYPNDLKILKKYVNTIIEGMKTGLFKYVAHPDFILTAYDFNSDAKFDLTVKKQMKRIIQSSIDLNIPLEINCGGIRYSRTRKHYYPFDEFFKLVGEMGAKVIIGLDVHNPNEINDIDCVKKALDLVNKYDLKLEQSLKI